MKRLIRNIVILIFPFLLMIFINEIVRPTIQEEPYSKYGKATMNSVNKNPLECSWICQNETWYCKEYHVKYLKPYYEYTDPVYFGMIGMLKDAGDYALTNIIFLVFLVPGLIWFFVIKSWNIQDKINRIKNSRTPTVPNFARRSLDLDFILDASPPSCSLRLLPGLYSPVSVRQQLCPGALRAADHKDPWPPVCHWLQG